MTEHPSDEPATDGAPAIEFSVVAGAGQTFDDLDSVTPLPAGATDQDEDGSSEDGSTGEAAAVSGEG